MKYGGNVCTILNNELQKVVILLLAMYTILPEPPQKSGITMIVYCILCKYVIVIMCIGPIHLLVIMYFIFIFLHHDVRMYDIFMGL